MRPTGVSATSASAADPTLLTGQITPVKAICDMARARGIETIVDGAHSFAQFDFKQKDLGCDYFGTSLHKWLFAPKGTGLLYVKRDKIEKLWPLMAAESKQANDIRKFEEIGTHSAAPKLAIGGGSNGGLLVGAALTQRPDLFGAALPAVGVMDMLRFQKFTIGWAWVSDYGSSDNAEDFKALYAYSPLHNIKPATAYPPTMITTADHDDRVWPGHSFKFAATLQAAQGGAAPILIRVETKAGHGAGKPTSKVIEEIADRWSFLVRTLDMKIG